MKSKSPIKTQKRQREDVKEEEEKRDVKKKTDENIGNGKKVVVGLGEILWDVFPGKEKQLGGAPANFAFHATQLGFEGYTVSAIGKDLLGKEILDLLAEKKLGTVIEEVDYPTGTVQVTLNDAGVPQYEICEKVAWDNIPFTKETEKLARKCDAVCFGSLAQRSEVSRNTIRRFMELVPDGAYKVFDINLRQNFYTKEIIHQSLVQCNALKINDEEVVIVAKILGMENLSELDVCKKLLSDYDLKWVVETKGATGSYVLMADETSYLDTPVVNVVDTVGAGDSFGGAFVAALLHGASMKKAHQLAVDVSSYVCTQHGAMPKIPATFVESLKAGALPEK